MSRAEGREAWIALTKVEVAEHLKGGGGCIMTAI